MEKEKWIDGVMQSTSGMQRAEPPVNLYDNVIYRINQRRDVASLPVIRWSVAAAVLLLVINFGSILFLNTRYKMAGNNDNKIEKQMIQEIETGSTYNY